ncbi:hypothetical protein WA158_005909 [Blastocystis sp. Blastoise]
MTGRQYDLPGFPSKRRSISTDHVSLHEENIIIETSHLMEELDSDEDVNSNSTKQISDKPSSKNNINDNSRIEDFVYDCWCQLKISTEKIKKLYELINDVIKLLVPEHELLFVPKNGQDIIRKYCSCHSETPLHKNIYICDNCKELVSFNGGRNLLNKEKTQCKNEECSESKSIKVSVIPLIPRIRYLMSSKPLIQDISYYKKEEIQYYLSIPIEHLPSTIPEYMLGQNYRKYMNKVINNGDIFLFFDLTCDGICVFSNPISDTNQSSFPILLKLLNYNNTRLHDQRVFWTYCITKESLSNTVLALLMKELILLSSGIEMDVFINERIEKKRVVAVLLNVYGDCMAITSVGSFTGPSSTFPCRYCEISWNRKNEGFHEGIKCAYKSIKKYIHLTEDKKKINEILYPSVFVAINDSNISPTTPLIDDLPVTTNTIIDKFPNECIYYDAFEEKEYSQRTQETINMNRCNSSENGSFLGIKHNPGIFESLAYFDASTSYLLDPMHLFNNICTLILNLLFHYNVADYTSKISKNKALNPESILSTFCLKDENISILNSRILAINTLYNDNEYEFRYILNEKKFWNMSSHTRIFFTSCILPLITLDFNSSDSPLVVLIDPLATIIRQVYLYHGNTSKHLLEVFRDQCNIFCFLCELLIPKELLNTQIHLVQHLYYSIINSGSIFSGSTYQSERFYSFLKRISFGRKNFNESSIRRIIEREVADMNTTTNISDDITDETQLEINKELYNEEESIINDDISNKELICESYNTIIVNRNKISTVKGIRGSERIDLSDNDMKEIINIILASNDESLKEILFHNVNKNDIVPYDILTDSNICNIIINNLRRIIMTFYSEVLINDSVIFTCSDIDEGIETTDNSYIMYFTHDQGRERNVHLIKSLCYIQIGSLVIIKQYEYPEVRISNTGLFYIINDSNEILSKRKRDFPKFISICNIEPDNLIIADIHEYRQTKVDDSYVPENEKEGEEGNNKRVVTSNTVITNTVFMTRNKISI